MLCWHRHCLLRARVLVPFRHPWRRFLRRTRGFLRVRGKLWRRVFRGQHGFRRPRQKKCLPIILLLLHLWLLLLLLLLHSLYLLLLRLLLLLLSPLQLPLLLRKLPLKLLLRLSPLPLNRRVLPPDVYTTCLSCRRPRICSVCSRSGAVVLNRNFDR